MNIISLFFASMRVASKVEHASYNANMGDSEELIAALCASDPVDRVQTRSSARDVEIDESLPYPV